MLSFRKPQARVWAFGLVENYVRHEGEDGDDDDVEDDAGDRERNQSLPRRLEVGGEETDYEHEQADDGQDESHVYLQVSGR